MSGDTDEAAIIAGINALAQAKGVRGPVAVRGITRIRGGNSSEIWAFDASWDAAGQRINRPLILRRGAENEFNFAGRGLEFGVLSALDGCGLPVPEVLWVDGDGAHLGRPSIVMERSAGKADRGLMTSRNTLGLDLEQRLGLGGELMTLLARLHALDPARLPFPDGVPAPYPADRQLADHDAAIERLEVEPMVELRIASWWLWRNLPPPPPRIAIVHADYRPANMLIAGGHVSAMLDWEFTHLGDPLEDLGWFLAPNYTHEHLIEGDWGAAAAIHAYESAAGRPVDRAAMRFWSVFATYKLAYMTVAALRWMADGDASRMTTSARPMLAPLLAAITPQATKAWEAMS